MFMTSQAWAEVANAPVAVPPKTVSTYQHVSTAGLLAGCSHSVDMYTKQPQNSSTVTAHDRRERHNTACVEMSNGHLSDAYSESEHSPP